MRAPRLIFYITFSVKYTLKDNFGLFWCPCCALFVKAEINEFFNPSSVMYMGIQVNFNAIANICDCFKHPNYSLQVKNAFQTDWGV